MSSLALVLFSGGYDSTLLVIDYLKQGWDVELFYVNIHNNKNKVKLEQFSVRNIVEELQKMFPFRKITLRENFFLVDVQSPNDNIQTSVQPLIWLMTTPFMTKRYHGNYTHVEISIGYIMGDQSISWLKEHDDLFNALKPFLYNQNVELVRPLMKTQKQEIVNDIVALPNINKFVNTCEQPFTITIDDEDYMIPCTCCETCSKILQYLPAQNYQTQIKEKAVVNKEHIDVLEKEYNYVVCKLPKRKAEREKNIQISDKL